MFANWIFFEQLSFKGVYQIDFNSIRFNFQSSLVLFFFLFECHIRYEILNDNEEKKFSKKYSENLYVIRQISKGQRLGVEQKVTHKQTYVSNPSQTTY